VLQDKENAVLIGTSVDELIRHHPSLKTSVFDTVRSTLSKIEDLGSAYAVQDSIKSWYRLLPPSPPLQQASSVDVVMEAGDSGTEQPPALLTASNESIPDDDASSKSHENIVISFIDVLCRVRMVSHRRTILC